MSSDNGSWATAEALDIIDDIVIMMGSPEGEKNIYEIFNRAAKGIADHAFLGGKTAYNRDAALVILDDYCRNLHKEEPENGPYREAYNQKVKEEFGNVLNGAEHKKLILITLETREDLLNAGCEYGIQKALKKEESFSDFLRKQ